MIDALLGDSPAGDWRVYVPVLRAKASEWKALKQLTPGVRHRIAPILEFIPDWKEPGAATGKGKRRAPQTVSVARLRGEIGLRFTGDDVGPMLASRIAATLHVLGVAAVSAHLIMDLKDQPAAISHAQLRVALGDADTSASVVVLGGVFPQDLMRYGQGVTPESREEWKVWWREHVTTPRFWSSAAGNRTAVRGSDMNRCTGTVGSW